MAPKVLLAKQQYEVIKAQIPSVDIKVLTGRDNVDSWKEKVWKAVLAHVRIVVSTEAVLSQALEHAFIKMDRLALLVFDEGPSFGFCFS